MTIRLITRGLPLLVLAAAWLWSSPAEAKGLVLVTSGETVKHVADLAEEQKESVETLSGTKPAIGFRYSYGGIFWLDFWTWDGEYCLFVKEGDKWRYEPLEPAEAAELAGSKEGELPRPIFYTFPPGLLLVGAIVVIWIGVTLAKRSKDKQFSRHLESVMNDPRYKRAMEIIQEEIDREPVADDFTDGDADDLAEDEETDGFQQAVWYLTSRGVSKEEAEQNLIMLLTVMATYDEE